MNGDMSRLWDDGTRHVRMEYWDGEHGVGKIVRVSDAALAVGGPFLQHQLYAIAKATREADRDIQYQKFGKVIR